MSISPCDGKALLGETICRRRRQQLLSQEQLAQMAGTSKSHLWRIEAGRVGVSLDLLCRLASSLDVKVSELIDF